LYVHSIDCSETVQSPQPYLKFKVG